MIDLLEFVAILSRDIDQKSLVCDSWFLGTR
jgi:hypothetical protein